MFSKSTSMRPKLKIPKTTSEKIFDVIGYSIFTGIVIFLMFIWKYLPDQVPAHYNLAGEVTRWGSKYELLILPLVALFSLIFMIVVERYPEMHNYPKRFNESNAKQFYLNSRKLMNRVKNVVLIIFSLLIFETIAITLGWFNGFGHYFLFMVFLLLGIPMTHSLIKRRQIQ